MAQNGSISPCGRFADIAASVVVCVLGGANARILVPIAV